VNEGDDSGSEVESLSDAKGFLICLGAGKGMSSEAANVVACGGDGGHLHSFLSV